jgi:hypothetical protein
MERSEIKIYKTPDGKTSIEVKLEKETVWLNQYQLEELFETNRSTINKHILNIYKSGELNEKSTCAKIAQVQKEGARTVKRKIKYYNLDVIIAVGYRVNSKRGTQFRIWANQIIKDYLVKGYAVNQQRLQKQAERLNELKETIRLIGETLEYKELSGDESKGLLKIISDYSYALEILDRYDYNTLTIENTSGKEIYRLTYQEAIKHIGLVRKAYNAGELFGKEKDNSFSSSLETIYQTFDGKNLYPSIEEKAANFLLSRTIHSSMGIKE